jgi:hypothetical protein
MLVGFGGRDECGDGMDLVEREIEWRWKGRFVVISRAEGTLEEALNGNGSSIEGVRDLVALERRN